MGGHALAPGRVPRQLARGGQVELRAARRRDRVLERLLDDRVHEPRRQARMQELGRDQGVDRVRGPRAVHAGDRGGVGQRGVVAEDRQRLRDVLDRRRVPAQAGGDEARHRRRAGGGDRAGVEVAGPRAPGRR